MYRKHLKMARGEGESGIRSHFVERVVRLPMVHVAWDYAASTYTHIKESNKLVNFTLTNAEKSVTFVAGQAKPVVLRFEKQIQAVDNLACKGLGTLEEKVPFITKPADEIMTDTRKLYTSTVYSRLEGLKKFGNDTIKTVTDYSLSKANAILGENVVKSLLTTVDGALVVTESYVDRILPPTPDEKKKDGKSEKQEDSSLSRLVHLTSIIRRRTVRAIALRIEHSQERVVELLIYPLGYIETSKVYLESLGRQLAQMWRSFKKSRSEENDTGNLDSSNALTAVRDSALWMIGMIRVIPRLLPMYIYGFVSWLEQKRGRETNDKSEEPEGEAVANGSAKREQNSSSHKSETSNYNNESHTNHQDPHS